MLSSVVLKPQYALLPTRLLNSSLARHGVPLGVSTQKTPAEMSRCPSEVPSPVNPLLTTTPSVAPFCPWLSHVWFSW